MEFKDRIRAVRNERGMSQTQLASELDKGESAVRMWEIGRSKPDADTLIKLAEFFGCTTDYLLGLSDTKNEKTFTDISGIFARINSINVQSKGLLIKIIEAIIEGYDVLGECDTLSGNDMQMDEFFLDKLDDLFESIKRCYDDVGLVFQGVYHMAFEKDDVSYYKGEIIEYSAIHEENAHNTIDEMLSSIRDKAVEVLEDYAEDEDRPTLDDIRKELEKRNER
jgi:transcriptional regulator with XRE-family HTH domain